MWEAATLMAKGLEHSVVHKYKRGKGKLYGKHVVKKLALAYGYVVG